MSCNSFAHLFIAARACSTVDTGSLRMGIPTFAPGELDEIALGAG